MPRRPDYITPEEWKRRRQIESKKYRAKKIAELGIEEWRNYKNEKEAQFRRNHQQDPTTRRKALLKYAKVRAEEVGCPFDLTLEDIEIPQTCPVLGLAFTFPQGKIQDTSPTVDRLIPALGYVKNNITVICWRANLIKGNSTLEEIEAVIGWLEKCNGS